MANDLMRFYGPEAGSTENILQTLYRLLNGMYRPGQGGGGQGGGDQTATVLNRLSPEELINLERQRNEIPLTIRREELAAIPQLAAANQAELVAWGEQERLGLQEAQRLKDPVGYANRERDAAAMWGGLDQWHQQNPGGLTPEQLRMTRNLASVTPQERALIKPGMDAASQWEAIFKARDEAEQARPKTYTS